MIEHSSYCSSSPRPFSKELGRVSPPQPDLTVTGCANSLSWKPFASSVPCLSLTPRDDNDELHASVAVATKLYSIRRKPAASLDFFAVLYCAITEISLCSVQATLTSTSTGEASHRPPPFRAPVFDISAASIPAGPVNTYLPNFNPPPYLAIVISLRRRLSTCNLLSTKGRSRAVYLYRCRAASSSPSPWILQPQQPSHQSFVTRQLQHKAENRLRPLAQGTRYFLL